MTYSDFIEAIEGYYGQYERETIKDMVRQYLQRYIPEASLPELYAETLKTVSTQYRSVPDIAVFETLTVGWDDKPGAIEYKPGAWIPENTASDSEAATAFGEMWRKLGRR